MWGIANWIRLKTANSKSYDHDIARGFITISLFVFLGKLVGAAREAVIAWRYGVSSTVDAYTFIFNLINLPASVFFSILTVVLVPLEIRLRKDNPVELLRFRSELLVFILLLGSILGIFFYFGLPLMLMKGWLGLTGPSLGQAINITPTLTLLVPVGMIVSLLSVWTMSIGRHQNTLLESVPSAVILLAVLWSPKWLSEPLIWGTIAGVTLQLIALSIPLRRAGEFKRLKAGFQSPIWQGVWQSIGIVFISQIMSSLTGTVDNFMAASLPLGKISILNYSDRIMALIQGLGATAIARSTLPVFSNKESSSNNNIKDIAFKWALRMFVGGTVVSGVGALLSPYFIQILFERGAFTVNNTHEVATQLRWSLIQIPFYFSAMVLVSALSSGRYYVLIAISGASNLLIKILFVIPLVKHYQLIGLALSTSAMYAVSLAILYVALRSVKAKDN